MFGMIREIPGPVFLLVYAVVVVFGVLIARKWIDADGTGDRPMPDFAQYDPISIALLKGGINEVIRTAVFMLVEKKLVEVKTPPDKPVLKAVAGIHAEMLPVEREIHNALQKGIEKPSDLFNSDDLIGRLEAQLKTVSDGLKRAQVLRNDEQKQQAARKKWIVVILVLVFGCTKLFLGIAYGRPIIFLAIELVVAAVLLLVLIKISPLSTMGRQFLIGLKRHFTWIKDELAQGKEPAGIDPAVAVALFGVGALVGFGAYQPFANAFPANRTGSSGDSSSGGCGTSSGCGGSSGSSSDSGGGGSDGGGGGCGGCGGGGD